MNYTVIAPVFNEEENVAPLVERIAQVMDGVGETYEILLVDDGSTDATLERIKALFARFPSLRVVSLLENRGQTAALQAGFDHARGERIVTIDGDLQMDPAHITGMIEKMKAETLDLVYFRKIYHEVPPMKRFASWIANRVRRLITGDKAVDVGSNYKLYRTNALKGKNFCSGLHRFFTGFMEIEGATMGYVEGTISRRDRGDSKYTNWKRLKQGLGDLFYFYLYKNRTLEVYRHLAVIGVVAFATGVSPLPFFIKAAVFGFLLFLFFFLFSLTIHALHVTVMRQRTPYRVKGVWPADGDDDRNG